MADGGGHAAPVNASSMIDLKAVLFSKASEVKRAKASGLAPAREEIRSKKKAIWAKRNNGVDKRNARDVETKLSMEEEDDLAKSKAALQRKAALYEKLTSGKVQLPAEARDNEEKGFLVDFEKKSYDEFSASRAKKPTAERANSEESGPDDWVDYVDSLGRSRRCLRKDLPQLQKMDADLSGKPEPAAADSIEPDLKKKPDVPLPWIREDATLMSEDMYRELRRQKWEEQEQELANRDGDIHYSDIRFDEVRDMGVGHYQFSTDQEERQEQMEQLQALRKETVEQRRRRQLLKDRRQAAADARLLKVKARRAQRLGQEGAEEGEVDGDEDVPLERSEADAEVDHELLVARTAEEIARSRKLEEERRAGAQLEWERGRMDLTSTRPPPGADEREEEFAPPTAYTGRLNRRVSAGSGAKAAVDLSAKAKLPNPFSTAVKNASAGRSAEELVSKMADGNCGVRASSVSTDQRQANPSSLSNFGDTAVPPSGSSSTSAVSDNPGKPPTGVTQTNYPSAQPLAQQYPVPASQQPLVQQYPVPASQQPQQYPVPASQQPLAQQYPVRAQQQPPPSLWPRQQPPPPGCGSSWPPAPQSFSHPAPQWPPNSHAFLASQSMAPPGFVPPFPTQGHVSHHHHYGPAANNIPTPVSAPSPPAHPGNPLPRHPPHSVPKPAEQQYGTMQQQQQQQQQPAVQPPPLSTASDAWHAAPPAGAYFPPAHVGASAVPPWPRQQHHPLQQQQQQQLQDTQCPPSHAQPPNHEQYIQQAVDQFLAECK